MQAYIMYSKDGVYLAFGEDAVAAAKGIEGQAEEEISVSQSVKCVGGKAFRLTVETPPVLTRIDGQSIGWRDE